MSATTYLLPATEGLTAGATADGPTAVRHGSSGRPAPATRRPRTTTTATIGATR